MSKPKHAPGVLCYVKNCYFPENEGKVVELLRIDLDVSKLLNTIVWEVKFREPSKVFYTLMNTTGLSAVATVPQRNLIPINDPGLTTDDLMVKELENV